MGHEISPPPSELKLEPNNDSFDLLGSKIELDISKLGDAHIYLCNASKYKGAEILPCIVITKGEKQDCYFLHNPEAKILIKRNGDDKKPHELLVDKKLKLKLNFFNEIVPNERNNYTPNCDHDPLRTIIINMSVSGGNPHFVAIDKYAALSPKDLPIPRKAPHIA